MTNNVRILLLALFACCACTPVPVPEVEVLPSSLRSGALEQGDFTLHYVESGSVKDPLVLFVHGTPGSWKAFARYLDDPRLKNRAHLISVDRPGFGLSAASGAVTSFEEQANYIAQLFVLNESSTPAIIVGHSLGGSLVYRLALDYPEKVRALVSISAPFDPAISGPRWYNQLARIPGARAVIGEAMAHANDEMMPLAAQLKEVNEQAERLDIPITLVHGAKDDLVKIENAESASTVLTNAEVRTLSYANDGHFIVWERHDEMVNEIVKLLDASL
ncbi:MAG: alpha/beta hydrolase [Pseudomonadota bacterium]